MSFKDFSLVDIPRKLGITIKERSLFGDVNERQPSPWLEETLKETTNLALSLGNEKARSELLIAPILLEVRRALGHRISFFSGIDMFIDESRGLTGTCDFILSRSPEQLLLRAPVVAVVEAKQENIKGGLGQCAAEMVASSAFNESEGHPVSTVYGAVTTGDIWRFLSLSEKALTIDTDTYPIGQIDKILGILCAMVEGNVKGQG
jgi:hypothetical protein